MKTAPITALCFLVLAAIAHAQNQPGPREGAAASPYAKWKNGPSGDTNTFPIAVWLQNPANAAKYKEIGVNTYLGLWEGPTEEQLAQLKAAGMKVICEQNEVGLKHLADPTIIGWMHGDEPDNAQKFDSYWRDDFDKVKQAWPQIEKFKTMKEYEGYGPPVPPTWIIEDYRKIKAKDPSRPVMLNLGQGVAWEDYIGRGERTGKLEDYPEYIKGADIVSFDIYPACHDKPQVHGNLWYVARGVDRLREWSKGEKTVWNVLECTKISHPEGEMATPRQVRCEIWMSLVHGSQGIVYFVHEFKPMFREDGVFLYPDVVAEIAKNNKLIAQLAPVINSPTITGGARAASSNPAAPVDIMAKKSGGATYVFSVAMRERETKADFAVSGISGEKRVEVVGEGRTIVSKGGAFQDNFKAWDTHIYRVE